MKQNKFPRPKQAVSLGKLMDIEFPADISLLGNMILKKSIGMIAGPRGGGKSWLAMIIAYAIAAAKPLHPWGWGTAAPVVYLDGEMRAKGLQERFKLIHSKNTTPDETALTNLKIISRDHFGETIGSIDDPLGQQALDALLPDNMALLIIDNLSAWTSGGREDANAWATIKTWLIDKRLQGVAVLIIHHTGKGGQQRGTSAHEDLLDYSILLSVLPGNPDLHETCFSIEHTKIRDYIPELRKSYVCSITTINEIWDFVITAQGATLTEKEETVLRLKNEGKSDTEIAKSLKVDKSTVGRWLKKIKIIQDSVEGVATKT